MLQEAGRWVCALPAGSSLPAPAPRGPSKGCLVDQGLSETKQDTTGKLEQSPGKPPDPGTSQEVLNPEGPEGPQKGPVSVAVAQS